MSLDSAWPEPDEDQLRIGRSQARIAAAEKPGSRWFDENIQTATELVQLRNAVQDGGLPKQFIHCRIQECEDMLLTLDLADRRDQRSHARITKLQVALVKELERRMGLENTADNPMGNDKADEDKIIVAERLLERLKSAEQTGN